MRAQRASKDDGPARLGRILRGPLRGHLRMTVNMQACSFSRRTAPEFCQPKPPSLCLQKNKGRRSAEKAQLSRGASPRIGCCHLLALRARPRAHRSALASRRSTAVLTEVSRPRLFDFRPGFLGRGSVRALPALACPSPAAAPRAPAVIPADMMPEAARERFARPPAGTALAPLSGSHLESALVERDGGAISRDGEEGQARSTK